jgi:hypothetical protein
MNVLRHVPIFDGLMMSQMQQLVDASQERTFEKDDAIIENAEIDSLFLIMKGSCEIIRMDGESSVLLHEFDYFGQGIVMDLFVRNVSVYARTDVQLLYISQANCESIFGSVAALVSALETKRKMSTPDEKPTFSAQDVSRVTICGVACDDRVSSLCIGVFRSTPDKPDVSTFDFVISDVKSKSILSNPLKSSVEVSELLALSKISSDNLSSLIPEYLGLFKQQNCIHLVYSTVISDDLEGISSKFEGKKVPDSACKYIGASISSALFHLHSLGIVYRAVQPESIHVDQFGRVVLMDYQLSKVLSCKNGKICGRTFTLCGATDYFAPEQLLSLGYGGEVDFWALGALLFETASGDINPFSCGESDVFEKILSLGSVKWPSIVFPEGFSEGLQDFISKLLVAQPGQRLGNSHNGIQGVSEDIHQLEYFRDFIWGHFSEIESPLASVAISRTQSVLSEGLVQASSLLDNWDTQLEAVPDWIQQL